MKQTRDVKMNLLNDEHKLKGLVLAGSNLKIRDIHLESIKENTTELQTLNDQLQNLAITGLALSFSDAKVDTLMRSSDSIETAKETMKAVKAILKSHGHVMSEAASSKKD